MFLLDDGLNSPDILSDDHQAPSSTPPSDESPAHVEKYRRTTIGDRVPSNESQNFIPLAEVTSNIDAPTTTHIQPIPMEPATHIDAIDIEDDDDVVNIYDVVNLGEEPLTIPEDSFSLTDEEAIDVSDDLIGLRNDKVRDSENNSWILENDYHEELPPEHLLHRLWPVCAIVHTYIEPTEYFDQCRRRASVNPVCRLRLGTYVDPETETWMASIVTVDPSQESMTEAGSFPPVASAIFESLNTNNPRYTCRFVFGPGASTGNLCSISTTSQDILAEIPQPRHTFRVSVFIHSDAPGQTLYPLLRERPWATYVRRRYCRDGNPPLPQVKVNFESLTRFTICVNVFAKDCLLTCLSPRDSEKVPNIDFAFAADRRTVQLPNVAVTPGSFGWSALPRGLDTYRFYPGEYLNLFEAGGDGSPLRVSSAMALEPHTDGSEGFTLDLINFDDNAAFEELADSSFNNTAPSTGVDRHPMESETIEKIAESLDSMLDSKDYKLMAECDARIPGMSSDLLTHQRKGVQWMIDLEAQVECKAPDCLKERGFWNVWELQESPWGSFAIHTAIGERIPIDQLKTHLGGILADDMGLGKTVQALACILSDPVSQQVLQEHSRQLFSIEDRRWKPSPVAIAEDGLPQGGTLIICPVSVISAWKSIVKEHTEIPSDLVIIYHGPSRSIHTLGTLASKLLVISTYTTLAGKADCPLHHIHWRRVILDEAHQIRNAKANLTKATLTLVGDRKWCLTGTPVQNKLSDLQPLLQFLRVVPFNEPKYGKDKLNYLQNMRSDSRVRLQASIQFLLLRRTKAILSASTNSDASRSAECGLGEVSPTCPSASGAGGASPPPPTSLLDLPAKTVHVVAVPMSAIEKQRYSALESLSRQALLKTDSRETAKLWTLMTHLRLMANTEAIVNADMRKLLDDYFSCTTSKKDSLIERLLKSQQMQDMMAGGLNSDVCPICLDFAPDLLTKCRHAFHASCFHNWLGAHEKPCPVCRQLLSQASVVRRSEAEAKQNKRKLDSQRTIENAGADASQAAVESTKVKSLCDRIVEQLKTTHEDGRPTKVVAFSTFVKLLKHIQQGLVRRGVRTLLFTGDLTRSKRDTVIEGFQTDKKPVVLLASIKAAGVGITLTAAHVCYVMDPWWNPHVEDQAIDRIHRIGQTRPVMVFRVVSAGTIEEAVVARQQAKRDLADAALETGASVADGSTTMTSRELRRIFFDLQ